VSKTAIMNLGSGVGGKIDKSEVLSAVEKYIILSSFSFLLFFIFFFLPGEHIYVHVYDFA